MTSPLLARGCRTRSLQSELSKPYSDRQALKSLCAGRSVPNSIRGQLWQSLLGIQRKPNVLADWQPTGELKTAALLRAECGVQAGMRVPRFLRVVKLCACGHHVQF